MASHPWSALLGALDLALPAECAGCGAGTVLMCQRCLALLRVPARPAWPTPSPAGLPTPWAVAAYDGPVRAALLAHKEHGRLALRRPLGDALARSVRQAIARPSSSRLLASDPIVLVPMPSRRRAVRDRGRDPTLDLARRAAQVLRADGRFTTVLPVLRLASSVQDQAGLDSSARAANLRGAVQLVGRGAAALLAGKQLLVLVDDIITTGASLSAAAQALRGEGLDVAAAALVAATSRHGVGRTG